MQKNEIADVLVDFVTRCRKMGKPYQLEADLVEKYDKFLRALDAYFRERSLESFTSKILVETGSISETGVHLALLVNIRQTIQNSFSQPLPSALTLCDIISKIMQREAGVVVLNSHGVYDSHACSYKLNLNWCPPNAITEKSRVMFKVSGMSTLNKPSDVTYQPLQKNEEFNDEDDEHEEDEDDEDDEDYVDGSQSVEKVAGARTLSALMKLSGTKKPPSSKVKRAAKIDLTKPIAKSKTRDKVRTKEETNKALEFYKSRPHLWRLFIQKSKPSTPRMR
jgi:hypothetical protein